MAQPHQLRFAGILADAGDQHADLVKGDEKYVVDVFAGALADAVDDPEVLAFDVVRVVRA